MTNIDHIHTVAKWAVMKSSECDYEIRAQLCRNFGMLYASQKNFKEALEQLSEDVYYLSLLYGPEHYAVAGAYFQVGRVFEAMGNDMVAKVNFQKTLDIWSRELSMEESDERAGLGITCDGMYVRICTHIHCFLCQLNRE